MKFRKLFFAIIFFALSTNVVQAKAEKSAIEELEKAFEDYEKKESDLEKQRDKIDDLVKEHGSSTLLQIDDKDLVPIIEELYPEVVNQSEVPVVDQVAPTETAVNQAQNSSEIDPTISVEDIVSTADVNDGGFPYKIATALIISLASSLVIWPMKKWYDNKPSFNLSMNGYYSRKSSTDNKIHLELQGKIYNNSSAPQHLDDIIISTSFPKGLNVENQVNSISVGHISSRSSFKFDFVKEIHFDKELPKGINVTLEARLIDQSKTLYTKNLKLFLIEKQSSANSKKKNNLASEREHQAISDSEAIKETV